MLKHTALSISPVLAKLFNLPLQTSYFPLIWKQVNKVLLFKVKRIGIDGVLLRWFESYLSHRTRVVLQGCSSDWRNIGAGVPQGSVLGPIMFLVYINDMKDDLQSSLSLFADDKLMHISSNSDETNKNILNRDLGIMKTWTDQWLIKFSVEKTKSMFVRYQGNTDDKPFNNHNLDNVSAYKHLGVIIQSISAGKAILIIYVRKQVNAWIF